MIQVFNMGLNGLLALCVAFVKRGHGVARRMVFGVSFFTLACYLDRIFLLIMENTGENGTGWFLQGVGVFVSKSILTALLMLLVVVRDGTEEERFVSITEGNDLEGNRTKQGWQYLDGLTLGIALFFLLLLFGEECFGSMAAVEGKGFGRVLLLIFFVMVMAGYAVSVFFHGKRQAADRVLAEAAARKQEADIYLEGIETHYQQTRELWHDLRNHINLLNLLLQEGKYGQMADYLRIFGEDVDALALPVKSGNLVVDALLADKTTKAKKLGAALELELCDLTKLTLKADEICGLLGNLLDNALEANSQVEEGKRFLRVTCSLGENCCYIRVRNACHAREDRSNGDLHSMKSDRKNKVGHGLGLRSVQRIVHGCGGELAVEDGGTQFTTVVRLPVG